MKPQDPRNSEELERMLHAGMGRAVLFLMGQDLSQYRDLILDSCLHKHAYDQQCEETRAEYLYPLIKLSGEEDFYRREILQALIATTDMWDAEQLLDFAMIFARNGDAEARETIYEKLRRNDMDDPPYADDIVIELDGMDGLIFLLDLRGRHPNLLARNEDDSTIRTAEEKLGIEEVCLVLQRAASENPNVAASLDNVPDYSPHWTAEEIVRRRDETRQRLIHHGSEMAAGMTWEDVKNSLNFRQLVGPWARLSPDEEFEKAAASLDPTEETERLKQHLFIFRKRPFPLDPGPLIGLVDHPDEWVALRAMNALKRIRHADVRALFHTLSQHPKWSEWAIGLLHHNYQQGDRELIAGLLEKETDPDRLHTMSHDTMDVYKDNPLSEGMQPLLLAYEKNPCSTCRHTCVETLKIIGDLPEWMVEECLHDAYSSTRELAQQIRQGISTGD